MGNIRSAEFDQTFGFDLPIHNNHAKSLQNCLQEEVGPGDVPSPF